MTRFLDHQQRLSLARQADEASAAIQGIAPQQNYAHWTEVTATSGMTTLTGAVVNAHSGLTGSTGSAQVIRVEWDFSKHWSAVACAMSMGISGSTSNIAKD